MNAIDSQGVSSGREASGPEAADHGRRRVVIDAVRPEIDCGRFAIKRVVGERVEVEAVIFADGHDCLSALLLHRHGEHGPWIEVPMKPSTNDVWRASFAVAELGSHYYTVQAWIDHFRSWRDAFAKKAAAGQDTAVDYATGAELVVLAARRARGESRAELERFAQELREGDAEARRVAVSAELADLMARARHLP
jgi:starch synthase (maltosyl-transferring)